MVNDVTLVKWDQMAHQHTYQITFKQIYWVDAILVCFLNNATFRQYSILDYLLEYPSQFSTIKNTANEDGTEKAC